MKCSWSSSQTGWPLLQNIHFSNGKGSFPFYIDFSFLCHWQEFYQTWLWVTQRMSYKKQELLTLCNTCVLHQFFYGVSVANLFSFLTLCNTCVLHQFFDGVSVANLFSFLTLWNTCVLHQFFDGIHVANLFRFLCCLLCFVCLRTVSCVPNLACVSGLFNLGCPFGFLSNIYLILQKI